MTGLRTRWLLAAFLGLLLIAASSLSLWLWLQGDARTREQASRTAQLRAALAEVETSLAADLEARTAWIASDNATIAYIADALALADGGQPVDTASIADLLEERRAQTGLTIAGVIDLDGRWVVGARPWLDSGGLPSGHALFQRAQQEHALVRGVVREDGRAYLGAILPLMRGGTIEAWLYAARPLDEAWLQRLGALVPATLVLRDRDERTLAQSGAAADGDRLEAAADQDPGLRLPLFGSDAPVALYVRLPDSDTAHAAIPVLAFALVWAAFWLLLLAVAWRVLLHPIDSACGLLERAAGGDYHLRAPLWRGGTRGRFATAFDTLMTRLGGRQSQTT